MTALDGKSTYYALMVFTPNKHEGWIDPKTVSYRLGEFRDKVEALYCDTLEQMQSAGRARMTMVQLKEVDGL